MVFLNQGFSDHEQVVFAAEPDTGLRAVLAVHDTRLGPALGGCRLWRYDTEEAAVADALRLSAGMTYKAALAGLPLGGGKSVVMLADGQEKTPALMRAMGAAVDRLGGRYIAAEDVGVTPADMDAMAERTAHVTGLSTGVGDPSPWTAAGVRLAIAEAVRRKLGRDTLKGVRVAVKGLGAVGGRLARALAADGAVLTLADSRLAAAERLAVELGAMLVDPTAAIAQDVDVYAPCALGGDLSGAEIDRLAAPIVCGAANNQLGAARDGAALAAKGVLYCPDYLVNAGGLISVARPPLGMGAAEAEAKLHAIPQTLRRIIDAAEAHGLPTAAAADRAAEDILAAVRRP